MTIYLGNNQISSVYLGTTPFTASYLGSSQVYNSELAIVLSDETGIESNNLYKMRTISDARATEVINALTALQADTSGTLNGYPLSIPEMKTWAKVGQALKINWPGTDPVASNYNALFNIASAENSDKPKQSWTAASTTSWYQTRTIRGNLGSGFTSNYWMMHLLTYWYNGLETWLETELNSYTSSSDLTALEALLEYRMAQVYSEYVTTGDGWLYNIANEIALNTGIRDAAGNPWTSAANAIYGSTGAIDDDYEDTMDMLELHFDKAIAAGIPLDKIYISDFDLEYGAIDYASKLDASTNNVDATNSDQIVTAYNSPQGKWNTTLDILVELGIRDLPQSLLGFQMHMNPKNATSDLEIDRKLSTLNRLGIKPLWTEWNIRETGSMGDYIDNNLPSSSDRQRLFALGTIWQTAKSFLDHSDIDTFMAWTDSTNGGANTGTPFIGVEFRTEDSGTDKIFPAYLGMHTAIRHSDDPGSRTLKNYYWLDMRQYLGPRYTVSGTAPVLDITYQGTRNTTTTGTVRYTLDRFLYKNKVKNAVSATDLAYFVVWEPHSAPASDWNFFDIYASTSDRIQAQIATAGNLKIYGKTGGVNNTIQSMGNPSSTTDDWNCFIILLDGTNGAKMCLNGGTIVNYTFSNGFPSGLSTFCILNHYAGTGGGWADGPRVKAIGVIDKSELTSDALIQSWSNYLRQLSFADGDKNYLNLYVAP